MTAISHWHIWEVVKCLCAHRPAFVNFSYSAKDKEYLSNFKHLLEQCQRSRGGGEAKLLSTAFLCNKMCMLIHADIFNEVWLLDNHVTILSLR